MMRREDKNGGGSREKEICKTTRCNGVGEGNGCMRYLRGLTRVSKRININIRSKDLRVTVCPTGREIESSPLAVLSKDSAAFGERGCELSEYRKKAGYVGQT